VKRSVPTMSFTTAAGGRKGSASMFSVVICARLWFSPGFNRRTKGARVLTFFSSTTF
jgi:hypothetical protein